MAMTFRRLGSVCWAGALLLAALGCSVETSSGGEEETESTTEALCDTAYYASVCQPQCTGGGCTDGSAIASCMSACIAAYCTPPH